VCFVQKRCHDTYLGFIGSDCQCIAPGPGSASKSYYNIMINFEIDQQNSCHPTTQLRNSYLLTVVGGSTASVALHPVVLSHRHDSRRSMHENAMRATSPLCNDKLLAH
jgi:hypothetical protein